MGAQGYGWRKVIPPFTPAPVADLKPSPLPEGTLAATHAARLKTALGLRIARYRRAGGVKKLAAALKAQTTAELKAQVAADKEAPSAPRWTQQTLWK